MNIVRRGSTANYGKRAISFEGALFSTASTGAVHIEATGVKDFDTKSHHNYLLLIEPQDLIQMLDTLAARAIANPEVIERTLSPALKSLVQLQYVVAGVVKGGGNVRGRTEQDPILPAG